MKNKMFKVVSLVSFCSLFSLNLFSQQLFIDIGTGYTKSNFDLQEYNQQASVKPFFVSTVLGFGERGVFGIGLDYLLLNGYSFNANSNNTLVYKEIYTDNFLGFKSQFYIPFSENQDEILPWGLTLGGGIGYVATDREIKYENPFLPLKPINKEENLTFNNSLGYNGFIGILLGPVKLQTRYNIWNKERSDGKTFSSDFLTLEIGLNLKVPL